MFVHCATYTHTPPPPLYWQRRERTAPRPQTGDRCVVCVLVWLRTRSRAACTFGGKSSKLILCTIHRYKKRHFPPKVNCTVPTFSACTWMHFFGIQLPDALHRPRSVRPPIEVICLRFLLASSPLTMRLAKRKKKRGRRA